MQEIMVFFAKHSLIFIRYILVPVIKTTLRCSSSKPLSHITLKRSEQNTNIDTLSFNTAEPSSTMMGAAVTSWA
jgi:hypothetical protein